MKEQRFNYKRLKKVVFPCPICAGTEFETLSKNDRYSMGIQTSLCLRCHLVMTNPRPTREDMSDFYRYHYRHIYNKVEYPTEEYIEAYEVKKRARYTVDFLSQRKLIEEGTRVLDVGCGTGLILEEIKRRCPGVAIVGVEPGEGFASFSRARLDCAIYSSIDQLKHQREKKFDVIMLNHVLEHVDDPVEFLAEIKGLLGDKGSVFIDVPNVQWYSSVEDLHIGHIYHFSVTTLTEVIRKAGLVVAHIGSHEPPKHPKSLRALALGDAVDEKRLCVADRQEFDLSSVFSKVNATALRYRFRRSWPGRIMIDGPKRLARMLGMKR